MPYLFKNKKLLEHAGHTEEGRLLFDVDMHSGNYDELLKELDLDRWYYTDKTIPYYHNKMGYRSDELDDINDNDYLLSFGCSYTYGTGLFYEDTWSYKLSKKLNLKNINLAIPGQGIQTQQYNTTLFVNNFSSIRLPKYVIYQYPHDYRVATSIYDNPIKMDGRLVLSTHTANDGSWLEDEFTRKYYLENPGGKYLVDYLTPLYLNNIWKALGVPVYHITFNDYYQEYKSDFQDFEILDIQDNVYSVEEYLYYMARDLSHNGRELHDKVKETILNKIKNG